MHSLLVLTPPLSVNTGSVSGVITVYNRRKGERERERERDTKQSVGLSSYLSGHFITSESRDYGYPPHSTTAFG